MGENSVTESITPTKTKTYQQAQTSFTPIGPVNLKMPRGDALVEDVPGLMTMHLADEDGSLISAAVVLYEPAPGRGHGYICQMDAACARAVAAPLMHMADQMEAVRLNG